MKPGGNGSGGTLCHTNSWQLRPLHRKRPSNNSIGCPYLEIVVATDASNPVVTHLWDASPGSNVNFLFSFAGCAFHWHHNVTVAGHRASMRGILPRPRRALAQGQKPEIKSPRHVGTEGFKELTVRTISTLLLPPRPLRKINRSVSSPVAEC